MTIRQKLLAAAMAALAGQAHGAEMLPGDPVAGQAFARAVCAECHDVEADWIGSPNPLATPFAVIAADPKMTETALRVFLQSPHIAMPNFILPPKETDDVVGYILSMRP